MFLSGEIFILLRESAFLSFNVTVKGLLTLDFAGSCFDCNTYYSMLLFRGSYCLT